MKLHELIEHTNNINIKVDDKIPPTLLQLANQHEQITGYVYPEDATKFRVGIYYNNELVGFMTPRLEQNKWRIGAIFVLPAFSGKGIAAEAIKQFINGKKAAPVSIDVNNISSQKSFQRAGYIKGKETKQWSDGSGNYNVWTKEDNV